MTKVSAATLVAQAEAKGYTKVQVVNALVRKVAHVEKVEKNPVVLGAYRKALKDARHALAVARAEGFVPCNVECMEAHVDVCVCACAGVNHGVKVQAESVSA